ncbi:MAG: single-stranded DNA-binding protein [Acidimicrobiales bacterium]
MGEDPTLRHTDSGKAVTEFSLAVDSYAQRQDSDADPDWFQIVVWGGLAEVGPNTSARATKSPSTGA